MKLWTYEDLLKSSFKVRWLDISFENNVLFVNFEILSVGVRYYVDDMIDEIRSKLKELSNDYEYIGKADIVFPENSTSMFYSFYVNAKVK
jgi:hypothetical protein